MRQREIIALEKRKAKEKAKREKEKAKIKEKKRKERQRELEKQKKRNRERRLKKKKIYEKKRRAELKAKKIAEMEARGDRKGNFRIIITESGTRVKTIGIHKTLLDAYENYNTLVSENVENVIGYKKFISVKNGNPYDVNLLDFEILLVENVGEENVYRTTFKEEGGKYVESVITDSDRHVILAKNQWRIPEYYVVYGYNQIKDKKSGKWIFDNLIANDLGKVDHKVIILFNQRLIIQGNDNFDIITCRYIEEAKLLFNDLKERLSSRDDVMFVGKVTLNMAYRLNAKIEEKTGWGEKMIVHSGKRIKIVPQVEHRIESLV